jgi:hypothetical protein
MATKSTESAKKNSARSASFEFFVAQLHHRSARAFSGIVLQMRVIEYRLEAI